MTLTPPAEIMGNFNSKTAKEIVVRRAFWIVDKQNAGHSNQDIAASLGITVTACRTSANRHGGRMPKLKAKNYSRGKMYLMGVYPGSLGNLFYSLPIDQQNRLIDLAIARKTTIANALVAHYLETAK